MKSISFNRNNAKGFSLIELLLVLGVLAILLVAAFVVYPQVRDRNQANAEVSNLTSIKANINNLYAARGGLYTGLTTDVANAARAFPQSMNGGVYAAGTAISSSWGGTVTTAVNAAAVAGIPANRSFNITYTNVPAGVCLGLVSGAAANFQSVVVGTTETIVAVGAARQFDPAVAAGACNGLAATDSIIFSSN